jgi:predicted RNA-binding Zn ribbon-like protein
MMQTIPPTRSASLSLVGSELALDFTNTSSGRNSAAHQEHLVSAQDVVAWACHARVIGPDDRARLAAAVVQDGTLSRELLRRALALREIIYTVGVSIATRRQPPAEPVEQLARAHADCVAHAHLVPHQATFVWTWDPKEAAIESVLGPITLSALTLLTQADLSRIKQCHGDHCGWLFFDTTKNKSRRWCEMEVCGNRAKQRRHQTRRRAGPADT